MEDELNKFLCGLHQFDILGKHTNLYRIINIMNAQIYVLNANTD